MYAEFYVVYALSVLTFQLTVFGVKTFRQKVISFFINELIISRQYIALEMARADREALFYWRHYGQNYSKIS